MGDIRLAMLDAVWYGDKKPWLPSVQLCDGKKYVCVSKWNSGFVKFATGKSMERRQGKVQNTCNLAILDRIRAARKEACNARVQAAIEEAMAADQQLPDEPRKKKQRVQPARDCDHIMCGNVVTVIVDGYQMNVLWSVTSSVVWVEFTTANLAFLQRACRDPDAPKGRSRAPKGQRKPRMSARKASKLTRQASERRTSPSDEEDGEAAHAAPGDEDASE